MTTTTARTLSALLDSHPSAHILTETLTRAVHALTTATQALQAAGKPIPPAGTALLADLCTIGDAWDAVCQTPLATEQATPAAVLAITITPHDAAKAPVSKLADADLHFMTGPLSGTRLIGFAVWERRGGSGRNVTFPARQYSVNGERRSFALLRPNDDAGQAHHRIRDLVLDAFSRYEDAPHHQTRHDYDQAGRPVGIAGTHIDHAEPTPPAAQASTTTTDAALVPPYGLSPQDQPEPADQVSPMAALTPAQAAVAAAEQRICDRATARHTYDADALLEQPNAPREPAQAPPAQAPRPYRAHRCTNDHRWRAAVVFGAHTAMSGERANACPTCGCLAGFSTAWTLADGTDYPFTEHSGGPIPAEWYRDEAPITLDAETAAAVTTSAHTPTGYTVPLPPVTPAQEQAGVALGKAIGSFDF